MMRGAIISRDELYRYALTRRWRPNGETIVWIMLNPSTADGNQDDNTIRRVTRFSQDWGYQALQVLNLFAYRATDHDIPLIVHYLFT